MPFIIQSAHERTLKNAKAYFSLTLNNGAALFGVFLAKDALLFYVFWELALIPIYLICLVYGAEGADKKPPSNFSFILCSEVCLCCLQLLLFGYTIQQEHLVFMISIRQVFY